MLSVPHAEQTQWRPAALYPEMTFSVTNWASYETGTAAAWADSSGRRNSLMKEVAMKKPKRRSGRSGRVPLRSPGRPPAAQREERRQFWAAITRGQTSEDAAS